MLPWLTGPRQQHRARSKALCRGATCRHNRVTSREFHGTYFLLAQAGRMVDATCRLQKEQVAAPNGPAKTLLAGTSRVVSRPQARAGLWLSCCLWPDLTSRTRGWGALGGRGSLRQRGSAVDGFDDVIGGEVVNHVAEPRKNGQLALGDLLVQTL